MYKKLIRDGYYFNPRSLAGATKIHYIIIIIKIFQSTLPRGSDFHKSFTFFCFNLFQSTLPRGSDIISTTACMIHIYFNPRSLAGATFVISLICSAVKFQSTLPRGSDHLHQDYNLRKGQFQSTLPRGSDCHGLPRFSCRQHFNPRSLAGATIFSSVHSPL